MLFVYMFAYLDNIFIISPTPQRQITENFLSNRYHCYQFTMKRQDDVSGKSLVSATWIIMFQVSVKFVDSKIHEDHA